MQLPARFVSKRSGISFIEVLATLVLFGAIGAGTLRLTWASSLARQAHDSQIAVSLYAENLAAEFRDVDYDSFESVIAEKRDADTPYRVQYKLESFEVLSRPAWHLTIHVTWSAEHGRIEGVEHVFRVRGTGEAP